MRKPILAIIFLVMPGCVSWSNQQYDKLKEAVIQQDVDAVKDALGGVDFHDPNFLSQIFLNAQSDKSYGEFAFDKLLEQSNCSPQKIEIARMLKAHGASASREGILAASTWFCAEALEASIANADAEAVAYAIPPFLAAFNNHLGDRVSNEEGKQMWASFKALKKVSDLICAKNGKEDRYCKMTAQAFKDTEDRVSELTKQEQETAAALADPRTYVVKGCAYKAEIAAAQSAIDHENEIGRISGVVNQTRLHEAGEHLLDYRNRLGNLQKLFQNKFSRSLDLKSCE